LFGASQASLTQSSHKVDMKVKKLEPLEWLHARATNFCLLVNGELRDLERYMMTSSVRESKLTKKISAPTSQEEHG
jgi:hypothetical protein